MSLSEVIINGRAVVSLPAPEDIYIERTENGYRTARLNGREIIWTAE